MLEPSNGRLSNTFNIGRLRLAYNVIHLWDEAPGPLLADLGLSPLAVLPTALPKKPPSIGSRPCSIASTPSRNHSGADSWPSTPLASAQSSWTALH